MSDAPSPRRRVTAAEFASIECNRCSACCERFSLWSPLTMALRGWFDMLSEPGLQVSRRAIRSCRAMVKGRDGQAREMSASERSGMARWLAALVPLSEDAFDAAPRSSVLRRNGEWRYLCPAFERDSEGLGVCTIYDVRPDMCAGFPYGEPTNHDDFPDCSFNVTVQGPPGAGLEKVEAA